MEAILPGSTYNQLCDCPTKSHQPVKRLSSSPTPLLGPSNDPTYVKSNEINVPGGHNRPPLVPKRPAETIEATENPYMTLLPSSPGKDKRTEAIASYTLEQVHLMINMFEQLNVQMQPVSPQRQPERKRAISEPSVITTDGVILPIGIHQQSGKHPSEKLHFSSTELSDSMLESHSEKLTKRSKPIDTMSEKPVEGASTTTDSSKQASNSATTKLSRQNAMRHSKVRVEAISTTPTTKLRTC